MTPQPYVAALLLCWAHSDPSAQANSTKASVNCTGTAVSSPNSLLQRLLLPVVAGDVVDVKEVLQRVGRAKLVSATGEAAGLPDKAWPRLLVQALTECCIYLGACDKHGIAVASTIRKQ